MFIFAIKYTFDGVSHRFNLELLTNCFICLSILGTFETC